MSQKPSKTMGTIGLLLSVYLEAYITATTAWAGHTHSHSYAPLHPPLVRDYLEDFGPTQDLYLLPAILHPTTGTQEGIGIGKHCPVSGSRACSGPDAFHQLEGSTNCGVHVIPIYYCQKCALEAWHICTECQTMNRDADPLPSIVYDPLIHQSRPWIDCAVAILIHYYPTDIMFLLSLFVHDVPTCFHSSITLHYIIPAHLITCH